MYVSKCDKCEKEIKDKKITVDFDRSIRVDLCEKCGEPVISFLKKSKLLDKK
jgi:NAD-dependent SIR2 family protein deacetylase